MSLVKDTADILQYLPVAESMSKEVFMPFIADAERQYLIPAIGKDLFNELDLHYNDENFTLTEEEEDLLAKCQAVIAPYAFMLWIPSGQLLISDAGIRIANTETHKTAFQWQIDKLSSSLLKKAGSALDDLYNFLEENKADWDLWTESSVYTEFKDCFISTTEQFSKLYNLIGNSRRNFVAIKSCMLKVQEFTISAALGEDFYNELLEEHKDGLSGANADLLPYIQKALAPLTMAKAYAELNVAIDERGVLMFDNLGSSLVSNPSGQPKPEYLSKLEKQAQEDGLAYLQKMKDFLKANISDYDTYAASDAYDSENNNPTFDRDSDSATFSFMI